MRKRHLLGIVILGLGTVLYFLNSSWWVKPSSQELLILSHRGVHQAFSSENLNSETCTAERIYPPTHNYVENTIESMSEAFRYGADMVELDVHLTKDGQFAVFHDWTVDCRTNGSGRTRDHSMAELKQLDIGYGYTFDGGESFPFRGSFVGAMPSLTEVFARFPDKAFLINFKSRSVKEGEAMVRLIKGRATTPDLAFTGHQTVMSIINTAFPDDLTLSRQSSKSCLTSYIKIGWIGYVPKACHNALLPVPSNYRHILWGWPKRFEERLAKHNSQLILMGPFIDGNSHGLDDVAALSVIPENYGGWIMTNKIELVGPALKS